MRKLEARNKEVDNIFYNNYIEVLKNKIFKILPMYENKAETLNEYTGFLLDEMIGCLNLYKCLKEDKIYGTVLSLVSFLHSESYNHAQCKSHVLSCINSLDKIKQKNTGAKLVSESET